MDTKFSSSPWRTLPPAGAPLPLSNAIRSLAAPLRAELTEKQLCAKLARLFQVQHVQLSHSGRSALSRILKALHKCYPLAEQKERTQVLIPAYVSYSVPSAVVQAGFQVRLYDIDPHTLGPDLDSVQKALSEKTLAVVLCHQFGLVYDGAPLLRMAQEKGTFMVDDAAQVMGGMMGKDYAGTMGHVGLFSLSRGKAVTAVEGGIILVPRGSESTRIEQALQQEQHDEFSSAIAAQQSPQQLALSSGKTFLKALALLLLRHPLLYTLPASLPWLQIGASIFEPHFPQGAMCPFSMGLCSQALALMEQSHGKRRSKAALYGNILQKNSSLRPIPPLSHTRPVYVRYPLLPSPGKEACIQEILQHDAGRTAKRLGISRGFPSALCAVPPLQPHMTQEDIRQGAAAFAGAQHAAQHLITLPTHDSVRRQDVDNINLFLTHMCS